MNPASQSSSVLLVCGAALLLGGCGLFGEGEVPQDVLNAPRLVATPAPGTAENATWPRLGDIPAKPADFTPPAVNHSLQQEMENDRSEANAIRQRVENPPPATQQP
jgi:hypothetical protein